MTHQKMPRVLITGATGMFAPYVIERARMVAEVVTTARGGGDLQVDLNDARAVESLIKITQPDVVIHLAAYTDVDGCERYPRRAFQDNAISSRNLTVALPADARLVLVSSDQVYPDCVGPHEEGSEAPINEYGRSKLAGEWAAQMHLNTCILRANIFGASRTFGRNSLSDFMSHAFSEGLPINLFEDVLFSPLHMSTLADLVMRMVNNKAIGVFNAASCDGASKAEFGLLIANEMGVSIKNVTIKRSTDITGRAPRIRDLRMSTQRISSVLGIAMPTLDEEIKKLKLSKKD